VAAEPVPVPDDTGQAALDLDWIVSVDDHVIEPPRVWLDRLPRRYHDVAPGSSPSPTANLVLFRAHMRACPRGLYAAISTAARPATASPVRCTPVSRSPST
jgi:hypothetical protein